MQGDRLMQFDVVLANPPYSIKQWDRAAFAKDPWGRNGYGTPPQGRADYAFWQHILASLTPSLPQGRSASPTGRGEQGGRCAILFPHGVLFRQEEAEMRRKLIEADVIEAVIGLGPNLFYNSPMEACVVICRAGKPKQRKGKILFINAVNEVTRERAQSFLTDAHIERIVSVYRAFSEDAGFMRVATLDEIRAKDGNLSIPLYVPALTRDRELNEQGEPYVVDALPKTLNDWLDSRRRVAEALQAIMPDQPLPAVLNEAMSLRTSNPVRNKAQLKDEQLDVLAGTNLFDRSQWQRVKFGDVVRMLKEQTDPVADGVERYVAGEHMETENVHIRKWGNVGDGYLGPAFIRKFRKGQVLYGSRRTYLKKVAVAEWDGVTANTTFVLEADEEKLLQELLPWLMLSDRFTKHSIQESKGSTNPYINFPDIAKFEFDLPPLDQQRRIADILWSADETQESWISTLDSTELTLKLFSVSAYRGLSVNSKTTEFPSARLGDLFNVRTGGTPSRANPDYWEGEIPWIKTGEVSYEDIYDSEEKITQLGLDNSAGQLFPPDSILMALYGQGPTLGRVAHLRIPASVNQACAVISPKKEYSIEVSLSLSCWTI